MTLKQKLIAARLARDSSIAISAEIDDRFCGGSCLRTLLKSVLSRGRQDNIARFEDGLAFAGFGDT